MDVLLGRTLLELTWNRWNFCRAEAERALSIGMQMVLDLGGQIGAGMEVDGLLLSKSPEGDNAAGAKRSARGVRLKDGTILEADLVICATGAW